MRLILVIFALLFALCGCRGQREVQMETVTQIHDSVKLEEIKIELQEIKGQINTDRDVEVRVDVLTAPDSAGVQKITQTKVIKVKEQKKVATVAEVKDTTAQQTTTTREVNGAERANSIESDRPPNAPAWLKYVFLALAFALLFALYKYRQQ